MVHSPVNEASVHTIRVKSYRCRSLSEAILYNRIKNSTTDNNYCTQSVAPNGILKTRENMQQGIAQRMKLQHLSFDDSTAIKQAGNLTDSKPARTR